MSGIRGASPFLLSTLGSRQLAYLRHTPLQSKNAPLPTTAEAINNAAITGGTLQGSAVTQQNVTGATPAAAATPAFTLEGILAPTAGQITTPSPYAAGRAQIPAAVPLTTVTAPTPITIAETPALIGVPQNILPLTVPLQNAGVTTPVLSATPTIAVTNIIPSAPVQLAAPRQIAIGATPAAAPAANATVPTPAAAPAAFPVLNTIQPNVLLVNATQQNVGTAGPATAVQAPTVFPPVPLQVTVPLQNVVTAAPAATPLNNAAAAVPTAAATQASEAIRQNALLINEALRNLGFTAATPPENLLFATQSPFLTALLETQTVTPAQQSALLVNEALQKLNFVPAEPSNPLLINELPAALEATGIIDELTLAQRNALLVNDFLLDVGFGATAAVALQPPTGTAQQVAPTETTQQTTAALAAAPQIENVTLPVTAPPAAATAATTAEAAAATTATLATTAVTTAAATTTTTTTIPVTAAFFTQGLTPATFPLTLFPDRTPYPLIVFQPNDPSPLPRPPEPINRQVPPTTPVARTRMVGDARLRQLFLGQEGRTRNAEYNIVQATVGQAEKSIRLTIGQANADMAAQGLPLHLVFSKHENGFALDVYDCSYNEACRLAYDVPIPLDNLPGVLGNLEHETGVIVDTSS